MNIVVFRFQLRWCFSAECSSGRYAHPTTTTTVLQRFYITDEIVERVSSRLAVQCSFSHVDL